MQLSTAGLVAVLIAAIALVVVLIVWLRMHASIALTIAALAVALVTGVSLADVGDLLENGVGATLGFLVLIIGFGAVLGKLLDVSGGAERLASTMPRVFGEHRAPLVMSLLGLLAGIPVFVEVGVVLLVPLVFVVAKKVGCSYLRVGVPLVISLVIVHCILPPHPAATAIAGTLGADTGTVILLGLVVALPSTLIGGPLYIKFALRRHPVDSEQAADESAEPADAPTRDLPGFGITLFTILLPLLIMIGRTIVTTTVAEGNPFRSFMEFVGHPIIALLISILFASWSLGLHRGIRPEGLASVTDESFGPIGGVLLIIGAGGAFNAVLTESGIADALRDSLGALPVSPVILAWLIGLLLHFSVGSATVAMISAAAIVLPMLQADPSLSPVIMALAIGAGAIGLTHVTDSLFWLYKEYMRISVTTALRTITVGSTLASVVALLMTLGLDLVI